MSIVDDLLGTSWELVTYQSETKDGEIMYPLGEDAVGVIAFTQNQYTTVQIMAANRDQAISPEVLETYNTDVEKEMARLGYHAYMGPFTVDEENSILTTHVELALIPEYVASEQSRKVTLDGDRLNLSNVQHPERKLVWKRIK